MAQNQYISFISQHVRSMHAFHVTHFLLTFIPSSVSLSYRPLDLKFTIKICHEIVDDSCFRFMSSNHFHCGWSSATHGYQSNQLSSGAASNELTRYACNLAARQDDFLRDILRVVNESGASISYGRRRWLIFCPNAFYPS